VVRAVHVSVPSITWFLCGNSTPIYIILLSLYYSHSTTLLPPVFTIFPDFLKNILSFFRFIRKCLLQQLYLTDFIIQFANNVKQVVSNFAFVTFVQYNTFLSG